MFTAVNMHMWDPSADNIKSSILTISVGQCSEGEHTSKRSKRSAGDDVQHAAVFEVEVPMTPDKPATFVNETPTVNDMLYHTFKVDSDSPDPVQINIYPFDPNVTLGIYIRHSAEPSQERYDSFHTITSNTTSTSLNSSLDNITNNVHYDLLHTLVIPKENITKIGTYFVGIAFHGKYPNVQ